MFTHLRRAGLALLTSTLAASGVFAQFIPVQPNIPIQQQQFPIQVPPFNLQQQPLLQQPISGKPNQNPNQQQQLPQRSVGAPRPYTPATVQTLPRYYNGQLDMTGNSLPANIANAALYSSQNNWPYTSSYNSFNSFNNPLTINPLMSPYNPYSSSYNSFANPYMNAGYPVSTPYSGVAFPSAFSNPFLNSPISTFQAPYSPFGAQVPFNQFNQFPLNNGFGF